MTLYGVPVEITPEPEGGFSVFCLTVPGCVSQGETVDKAVANITVAFVGLAEGYRAAGEAIPWGDVEVDRPIRKNLVIEVK